MSDHTARKEAIARFAGVNSAYYQSAFRQIGERRGYVPSFNIAAALLGPIWLGGRRLGSTFWPFLIADLLAAVLIAFSLAGGTGTDQTARADRLDVLAVTRLSEAKAANDKDASSSIARSLTRSATALVQAAKDARQVAEDARNGASLIAALGFGLLITARIVTGGLANHLAERRFRKWRLEGDAAKGGFSLLHSAAAAILLAIFIPIVFLHFNNPTLFNTFPSDPAWNSSTAAWLDALIASFSSAVACCPRLDRND